VEDSVTVKLGNTDVTLPFDARQDLLVQLGENDLALEIRSAFATAGATEPVELTPEQKTYLLGVIERRADEDLPEGVPELRDALARDLV
jgi:hypothetical protein